MRFSEILDVVKSSSNGLTNKRFVYLIMDSLGDSFGIENAKKESLSWKDNRVSELVKSDKLPSSYKTIFILNDFQERLAHATDDFIDECRDILNINNIECQLDKLYKGKHTYQEPSLEFCENKDCIGLFKCLYDFFACQYNNYRKNIKSNKNISAQPNTFSSIIKEIIKIESCAKYECHIKPYSIEEKNFKNNIDINTKEEIETSFYDYYDTIEFALTRMSELDLAIKQRFLNIINSYYFEYLREHDIKVNDEEQIKAKSSDIIYWIRSKVSFYISNSSVMGCDDESIPVYSFALVVYAFYKCRILLKVDGEK